MADTIIVSASTDRTDPEIYWFSLSVDDGVSVRPVTLTASSVVLIERQVGGNWSSDLALTVAQLPGLTFYAIRTTIPAQIANGQERVIRLTVDGTVYGPWSFRFYA